jgi:hypothetical protein
MIGHNPSANAPRIAKVIGSLKPTRAGAPGIQVEHAIDGRDLREVGKVRDDDIGSRGDRIDLQRVQVV